MFIPCCGFLSFNKKCDIKLISHLFCRIWLIAQRLKETRDARVDSWTTASNTSRRMEELIPRLHTHTLARCVRLSCFPGYKKISHKPYGGNTFPSITTNHSTPGFIPFVELKINILWLVEKLFSTIEPAKSNPLQANLTLGIGKMCLRNGHIIRRFLLFITYYILSLYYFLCSFMQNGRCHYKSSDSGATDTGYVDVKEGSEMDLQSAVATVGPISVAIDASHTSFQVQYITNTLVA